jgi:hypothetical protein
VFKKKFGEVEDACLAQAMVDTVREPAALAAEPIPQTAQL